MMMRKRTRSVEKDHLTNFDGNPEHCFSSDVSGNSQKPNNFFNIPSLFVGMSPKGLPDSDSVRSPTSPLDFRAFSNLCNSPRSPRDRHQKIWDNRSKVGLSIVDCLDENGSALRSPESKNIIFGSRMRIMTSNYRYSHADSFEAPKSLPSNFSVFPQTLAKSRLRRGNNADVVFEITEAPSGSECVGKAISCSLDSGRSFAAFPGFPNRNPNFGPKSFCLVNETPKSGAASSFGEIEFSSPSEIELSEDYTCVTSHGSNPKTTHIYSDRILGRDFVSAPPPPTVQSSGFFAPSPPNDFLSFCYSCNKKLEEGKDIYIYMFSTNYNTQYSRAFIIFIIYRNATLDAIFRSCRGEKAFCSSECRLQEILIDEELEKGLKESSAGPPELGRGEEPLGTGIFTVT